MRGWKQQFQNINQQKAKLCLLKSVCRNFLELLPEHERFYGPKLHHQMVQVKENANLRQEELPEAPEQHPNTSEGDIRRKQQLWKWRESAKRTDPLGMSFCWRREAVCESLRDEREGRSGGREPEKTRSCSAGRTGRARPGRGSTPGILIHKIHYNCRDQPTNRPLK